MILEPNVCIDEFTDNKIVENRLNIADHLLLSVANQIAKLFPNNNVYVGSQQQDIETPCFFVDYSSINNNQKLDDLSEYTFLTEISYIPKNELSRLELNSVLFVLEQNLSIIKSDIGIFRIYSKDSDITDGIAHITSAITALEQTKDEEIIIEKADKELII